MGMRTDLTATFMSTTITETDHLKPVNSEMDGTALKFELRLQHWFPTSTLLRYLFGLIAYAVRH